MSPIVPNAPDFQDALTDIQEHLPGWWRTTDPSSQLYAMLTALALPIDELSALWEQPYLDQCLATASVYSLLHNFAFAWGLTTEEQLLPTPEFLAFLNTLEADGGDIQSMVNALLSLVTVPSSLPALTWPVLTFPADGSGLTFPADGSGLTLGVCSLLAVEVDYATYTMTVLVLEGLLYDAPTFARAVARFRYADWLPTVITPVAAPLLAWTIGQMERTYFTIGELEAAFSSIATLESDLPI